MPRFDAIVCGLGVMGSAALCELARRGVRALGIERFAPGHAHGSSHGATRIIRLAYWEHPSYVPLVRRAFELWRALEAATGCRILHPTGVVEIGAPSGPLVRGSCASAHLHDLRHEVLAAQDLMQRFPAFEAPKHFVGVVQPDGGFLEAEPAVAALLTLAEQMGAEMRFGQRVRVLDSKSGGVTVITDDETIEADTVIVTAGAWTGSLLPQLGSLLRATRQVVGWFTPRERSLVTDGRFPVFLIESERGLHYGFPPHGAGIKAAVHHHHNETVDLESYDRTISAGDETLIRAGLAEFLPAANGPLVAAQTCLYTMTPDGDFVIDRLPDAPRVMVASPCSGHGFKFAPAIGEILADLVTEGATRHDITRFSLRRFT